jgi:hypothetical protein
LFVLAAFFDGATLLASLRAAILAILLFAGITLMTASLLALLRIASRRLRALAALLTGACICATLLHTLIAITIVCHIHPPLCR